MFTAAFEKFSAEDLLRKQIVEFLLQE